MWLILLGFNDCVVDFFFFKLWCVDCELFGWFDIESLFCVVGSELLFSLFLIYWWRFGFCMVFILNFFIFFCRFFLIGLWLILFLSLIVGIVLLFSFGVDSWLKLLNLIFDMCLLWGNKFFFIELVLRIGIFVLRLFCSVRFNEWRMWIWLECLCFFWFKDWNLFNME